MQLPSAPVYRATRYADDCARRRKRRCPPTAGLDAVGAGLGPLVAVKLVIESGILSAEHVLNVLARLNAGPVPVGVALGHPAETSLHLTEAPLANTDRYDSLRGADDEHGDALRVALEVDHE